MFRRPAAAFYLLALSLPAAAMVGGAPAVDGTMPLHEVMILSARGNLCTGIVVARDLVLTAAHCMPPGVGQRLYELDADRKPVFGEVGQVVVHPQFSLQTFNANRATADVALMKLPAPLPAKFTPATLAATRGRVVVGESFLVTGYGVTVPRSNRTAATLRSATLVATGRPGNLQLRLVDPAGQGETEGLGACTGDSGGPVYQQQDGRRVVIGLVSWTTGPAASAGCGGMTGVTPLELYLPWIVSTAKSLGSPLGP